MATLPFHHMDYHILPHPGTLSAEVDVQRLIFSVVPELAGEMWSSSASFPVALSGRFQYPQGSWEDYLPPFSIKTQQKLPYGKWPVHLHSGIRMKARLQHVLSCLRLYLLLIDLHDRLPSSAETWTVIIDQVFPSPHPPFFLGQNQKKINLLSEIKLCPDCKFKR